MTQTPDNLDILGCPLSGMTLVEASAGTGKTWNICGLYLRLLLEARLAVPEILVVTFTHAATAELRERIRARIMEMLLFLEDAPFPAGPDPFLADLATHLENGGTGRDEMRLLLRAALSAFDEAMISTIHGFCRKVAGTLAFGTGQPFSFTVERAEKETLVQVVQDFWRRHVASDALDKTLARYLYARKITPEELVSFLQREMDKPLAERRWPEAMAPMDPSALEALLAAYNELEESWNKNRDALSGLVADAVAAKNLSGTRYGRPLPNILAAYDRLFRQKDPVALAALSDASLLTRLSRLTESGMDEGKNKGKTPPSHPFLALAERWLALREDVIKRLERAWLFLLFLLSEEADEVRKRRRENRILTADDMLYRLYAALSDTTMPGLPDAIRRLYPAALIDEFQDTDPVQFFIFHTLYAGSGAPVFFVGDPKQAIYRFRNADLYTYLAAKKEVDTFYSLTHNQRSTPEMIAAANALFLANPAAFMLEGLDYPPVSPGSRKRDALLDDSGTEGSGMVIWRLPKTENGDYLRRTDARLAAAAATAGEIARLLHAGQSGKIRIGSEPLMPADIAVLVRTHNEAKIMQQALSARGLPSVSLSPGSVFHSPEARELAVILSAIITPRHQARLRAALATEMLGMDAAAIDALASHDEKAVAWVARFMAYQSDWLMHGVSFALQRVLQEHDVHARMLSLPDGERRLTNILHLAELLNEAGEIHAMPESLLAWLHRQEEENNPDEQAQMRLESDEKLIRIMTIHAAKGLEFPFVFCPFLWDAWRRPPQNRPYGMAYQDGSRLVMDFRQHDAASKAGIENRIQLEEAADQSRLVYVALTRAIYRAYLAAGCYRQSTSVSSSTAGTLNWLVAGNGISPGTWIAAGDESRVAAIEAGWQKLAQDCAHITLTDLPAGDTLAATLPGSTDAALALSPLSAAPLPETIPPGWRIGSYSALADGASHEASGVDRDERAQDTPLPDGADTALPPDDILLFPASRYAGNCLHTVFEQADFTDESTWDAAIDSALLRHPPHGRIRSGEGKEAETLRPMIRKMMKAVLETPLHDGIRLSRIGREKRLTELEFFLPAKNLSAAALNALLDADYPGGKLAFLPLNGYLKGLIDLVIEHDGRFYLLDWKSNLLGRQQPDYGEAALAGAMEAHHYHLQHLIYTVALDRFLARRMPDYDYDTHFGGALYLFVRGIRPDWKQENGQPSGVFFHRADAALVRRLAALISEGDA